ncbi:hypothetical protein QBZ16_003552 [Prototheca wickerhamii]|uniref:Aspartokinase n=1 Tax=Prototheca wickerhamii TaxID=3111 RepID=A0AAD9IM24_PROWI|nr:hypothetical protein QBZ16_003552 [Prototheca wickerhamii]
MDGARPMSAEGRAVRSTVPLDTPVGSDAKLQAPGQHLDQVSVVMKFGGSSVANAGRLREVAQIVCSFPDQLPCVVLSAMGKTTNLLLQAGEEALHARPAAVSGLAPLRAIRDLHLATAAELEVGPETTAEVQQLLHQLEQLLVGISIMQDLTHRARDSLVSFGERLSTRLFAAYLRAQGVPAAQHDAFDIGVITSDTFTNADVSYELSLPALREALTLPDGEAGPKPLPIVTGFLGRGQHTGAITTLGRGGSDLTCTLLGAALGLPEVQVWKDVDGVLTTDPRVVPAARPVAELTFEEATELAFFGATVLHPQAMQPAQEVGGQLGVRVKNSYNRGAPGTLITADRDMSAALVTAMVLKSNVTMYGFLARVFDVFARQKLSVDVRDLIEDELEHLMSAFQGIAKASYRRGMSIICLICNVQRTSHVLERVFNVLGRENVNVQMMSQGASKTNISLIVRDGEAKKTLTALHAEFFEQQQ